MDYSPISMLGPNMVMWYFFNAHGFIASAVLLFALGAAWYSKTLFGSTRMRLNGLTEEKIRRASSSYGYFFTILCAVFLAGTVATGSSLLDLVHLLSQGAKYQPIPVESEIRVILLLASAAGLWCIITVVLGMMYGFSLRPFRLLLIDSGYIFVGLLITALIIGFTKITPDPSLFRH